MTCFFKFMYNLTYSKKFKKDFKKLSKNKKILKKIIHVLRILRQGKKLDARYKNHKLRGKYQNCQECHITADLLLIYEKNKGKLIILLLRLSNHADLF